jgi:hypothetical protein
VHGYAVRQNPHAHHEILKRLFRRDEIIEAETDLQRVFCFSLEQTRRCGVGRKQCKFDDLCVASQDHALAIARFPRVDLSIPVQIDVCSRRECAGRKTLQREEARRVRGGHVNRGIALVDSLDARVCDGLARQSIGDQACHNCRQNFGTGREDKLVSLYSRVAASVLQPGKYGDVVNPIGLPAALELDPELFASAVDADFSGGRRNQHQVVFTHTALAQRFVKRDANLIVETGNDRALRRVGFDNPRREAILYAARRW